jgi:hypothetical protein
VTDESRKPLHHRLGGIPGHVREEQPVIFSGIRKGDAACLSLVLTRIEPPLRPRARTVEFDFDPDGSIAEQSKQILTAVSKGQVDPDTAKVLIDMLTAYVGLKDIESFLVELKKLRNDLPAGGVWTT